MAAGARTCMRLGVGGGSCAAVMACAMQRDPYLDVVEDKTFVMDFSL